MGIYLIILIGLMVHGRYNNPTLTLQTCLANPDKYNDAYLEIANEITVQRIEEDGFIIHQAGNEIKVVGKPDTDLPINAFIHLKVIFHIEGWLELVDARVAEQRRAKIWISVLPVLLVLFLFFRQYRFAFKRLQFEERA